MSEVKQVPIEFTIEGYRIRAVDQNVDGELFLFYDSTYYKTETGWTHEAEEAKLYSDPVEAQAEIDRLCNLDMELETDVDSGYTKGVAYFLRAPQEVAQIFEVDGADDFKGRFTIEPVVVFKPVYVRDYHFKLRECTEDGTPIKKEE
jgi:hypothetical protein